MLVRALLFSSVFFLVTINAAAQRRSAPVQSNAPFTPSSNYEAIVGSMVAPGMTPPGQMDYNLWEMGKDKKNQSPLQGPSGSVSALDLKAPEKARREYFKGYQLLMRKDLQGAVNHLSTAVSVDEEFVSAHNALGTAYFQLGRSEMARDEFAKAVSLDSHLPSSYMNLGSAQMALQDYRGAEESVQKASSMAPLDLQLATALAYAQLMNHDYPGVLATAQDVHSRKHESAAIVHYFAAAAWEAQKNQQQSQQELETLLLEDPASPGAGQARRALDELKASRIQQAHAQQRAEALAEAEASRAQDRAGQQQNERAQLAEQESKEEKQIAEAESSSDFGQAICSSCGTSVAVGGASPDHPITAQSGGRNARGAPFTFRTAVDEVAVFFAATDHGKSVTDLTREEIGILDNQKPPATITGFRNEAELPLRLGIVIDTSESVVGRFDFERHAARRFLEKVLTHQDDLAFIVGVANSVLLVQDFTNDPPRISRAIDQLAPAGGTALWDAVAFSARKLSSHNETQPVAKLLVVISDGKDNSSNASLKDAIKAAEDGEVIVYTVSAAELSEAAEQPVMGAPTLVGDRALRLLAERTGGAAFTPRSLRGLDHGLDQVQQVIRSRYLISYKPALFKHDGRYRAIDITARKSGRRLRVYARKGYFTQADSTSASAY